MAVTSASITCARFRVYVADAMRSCIAVLVGVLALATAGCVSKHAQVDSSDAVRIPAADVARGARVVFFGDSWTAGYAAAPGKDFVDDMARTMHWSVTNAGLSATGYLNPGTGTGDASYPARAAALKPDVTVDLVVVQGSVNDVAQFDPDGRAYVAAARRTWAQLERAYPNAALFIVGPICPTADPPAAYAHMDAELGQLARTRGIAYQSGLTWFNSSNRARDIDAQKLNHPNTVGHRVLATDIEAALKQRAGV